MWGATRRSVGCGVGGVPWFEIALGGGCPEGNFFLAKGGGGGESLTHSWWGEGGPMRNAR